MKFSHLLRIQFLLEARHKETLTLLLALSLMISIVVAMGVQSSYLDPAQKAKLFPSMLWIVFLLSATVSIGRSFEYEVKHAALEGLLLCGVPPHLIYIAKTAANFILLCFAQTITTLSLWVLLNLQGLEVSYLSLVLVSALVILAYAALSTLFAGIAISARMRQILLPIILIPLLFPLFYAATELTNMALSGAALSFSSEWFGLLIILDALYLALGLNLFEHVIKE